jgi:hypothetical protein
MTSEMDKNDRNGRVGFLQKSVRKLVLKDSFYEIYTFFFERERVIFGSSTETVLGIITD